MIRSLLSTASLAAIVALAAPAHAKEGDFASGQMLAHACGSTAAGEKSLCDGYIAGAFDSAASEMKGASCLPPNTKLAALREAVAHYAPGHVDDTKGSGVALLSATVKATYPCPAK